MISGEAGLRLAGDAVLELWQREDAVGGDRTTVRRELLASAKAMTGWYDGFAASVIGAAATPEPQMPDKGADRRLAEAVRGDLLGADGHATATAIRVIWTGDHLEVARRLQRSLAGPVGVVATPSAWDTRRRGHRRAPALDSG